MTADPVRQSPSPDLAARRMPIALGQRLIALEKSFKAGLFLLSGVFLLHAPHANDLERTVVSWLEFVHIDPHGHRIDWLLHKLTDLPDRQFRAVGVGAFLYATLYLTEAVGLWLGYTWASWLSVLAGGTLLPIEIIDLVRYPSWGIVLTLITNVVIVAYLVHLIYRERRRRAQWHAGQEIDPTPPAG